MAHVYLTQVLYEVAYAFGQCDGPISLFNVLPKTRIDENGRVGDVCGDIVMVEYDDSASEPVMLFSPEMPNTEKVSRCTHLSSDSDLTK